MRTRLGVSSSLQTQSADQTHASLLLLLSCTQLHRRKWCGVCETAPTPSELMPLHEEPVYPRTSTNAKRVLPCPKERKKRRKKKKRKKEERRRRKGRRKKEKKEEKRKRIDDFVVAFAFAYPHSKKQSSSSLTSYLVDFFFVDCIFRLRETRLFSYQTASSRYNFFFFFFWEREKRKQEKKKERISQSFWNRTHCFRPEDVTNCASSSDPVTRQLTGLIESCRTCRLVVKSMWDSCGLSLQELLHAPVFLTRKLYRM